MSMLSDNDIFDLCLNRNAIEPFTLARLQPASYDVSLGDHLSAIGSEFDDPIILPYSLKPHEFVLGFTEEYLNIPDDLYCRFEGKSSLGRRGLMTHVSAGFVDPGFQGQLTLEIFNVSNQEIRLEEGMLIGQLCFGQLTQAAHTPYGSPLRNSHYQGQTGPTPNRS